LKRASFFLLLCAVAFGIACGGSSAPKTSTGGKTSGIKYRVFVTNTYSGQMQIIDAATDVVSTTNSISVGSQPTYMVPSVDSKYTVANTSNSQSVTSVENLTESAAQQTIFQNTVSSFVLSQDNKSGFAAIPNYQNSGGVLPGAVHAFNYIDGSTATVIPVPSVSWLAIDHAGKHILALTNNSDTAYWIDLTTVDLTQAVQNVAVPIVGLTLNAAQSAFFSSDDSKVYILNCGPECGGSGSPSVTEFTVSSMTATGSVNVQAARIGTMTNNTTLWVAGSPGGSGGAVQSVTLSSMTAGTPITTGVSDGTKVVLRYLNNKLWLGSTSCTSSSCLTIIDPTGNTAKLGVPSSDPSVSQIPAGAPNAGDVTGMTYLSNRTMFYVVEGGHVHLYGDTGAQQTMLNNFLMTGKAYDVLAVQ